MTPPTENRPFWRVVARWVVARALGAFPAAFRREFGPEMLSDFDELHREACVRGRLPALAAVARTVASILSAGVRERLNPTCPPARRPPHPHREPDRMLMDVLRQDLRFALRSLLRRPGFTVVAVLTLALGIGSTAAIFSLVQGVLLRPLPFPEPERLAMLWSHGTGDPAAEGWLSQPDMESVREMESVEAMEAFAGGDVTLTGGGEAVRVDGARVTGGLLDVFGMAPAMGRDIRREENVVGGPRVVVLSWDLWRTRFGGDPNILGRTVELSETSYEVVGVAPDGFDFPGGARLWRPYYRDPERCGRGCHIYNAVARLPAGVTFEVANAEVGRLAATLRERFPESNFEKGFRLEPLLEAEVGEVRTGLWIVLGAVGLVLLIACANVANLLLVRASARRGEVALRAALGASRRRLVGQVLIESLVLAGTGAALGLAIALGAVSLLRRVSAGTIPRMESVAVDGTVVLVAVGLAGLATLLAGLSPALHLARTSVVEALGRGGRGGQARREVRTRAFLLAGEVALSLVLLVGAGLLTRSLVELRGVDLGLEPGEVVRFGLNLPSSRYATLEEISIFYAELEGRLAALPGVESVGSAFGGPLRGGSIFGSVQVEGRPEPAPADETNANVRSMTPGYLRTVGYPVLRGRRLTRADRTGPPVALVNETFVEQNFPGEDPLGQRVRIPANFGFGSPTWTIVGVVGDVRPELRSEAHPEIYVPHAQFGPGSLTVNVRGVAGMATLAPAIRRAVRDLDPNLPVTGLETLDDAIRGDAAVERFYLLTVGLFAALAVLLAAVGLYGVVAYLASRRVREFGIRIALGARDREITGLVVRQVVPPVIWGVLMGLGAAWMGVRMLEAVLYQVDPRDPRMFAGATVAVVAVALMAAALPARRATRIDPVGALAAE